MTIHFRLLAGVAGLLMTASTLSAGELRTWRDSSGKEIKARLVEVKGAVVVLEKENGGKSQVPLARLSAEDQEYAKSQAELAKSAPAAPNATAAPAGGRGTDKNEPVTITLPDSPTQIAYLPGSEGGYDGFYAYQPKLEKPPKLWPTLLAFPSHRGAEDEIKRYQKAADEVGWLIVVANDQIGITPEIKKRNSEFLNKAYKSLPIDRRRFTIAGGDYTFGNLQVLLSTEKKIIPTGMLSLGSGYHWAPLPKDATVYLLSPTATEGRYLASGVYEKADKKTARLKFYKGGGEPPAEEIRRALIYLNAQYFKTSTGKAPEAKAERDAFTALLTKDLEDNKEFDPAWAAEVGGILQTYPLAPDALKKVKDTLKTIEASEDMVKFRKFERDLEKFVADHLAKGYDEKKADDHLKKMQKDAEKLTEKHKDARNVDLVKALSEKPLAR